MHRIRLGFLLFVLVSFFVAVSTSTWAAKPLPVCGDGKCQKGEESCLADCGTVSECGDGICSADETYESCPADCEPPPPSVCNNDNTCNDGEDCLSCPNDCAGITTGKPSNRYCCGEDNFCEQDLCGADCGTPLPEGFCGDGTIDAGEQCDGGADNGSTTCGCQTDCTYTSTGIDCDDDLFCTVEENCDGTGYCGGGSLLTCDDGVGCTADSCDEANDTCGNIPDNTSCDDGIFCNGAEFCDPVNDCTSGAEPCLPGENCNETSDSCEVASFCGDGSVAPGEECDDGGESAACDADCTWRTCGDGTTNLTAGEECDDAGETVFCNDDCTYAECGDGTLNTTADEECDDGNTTPGDGCDELCLIEPPPEPYCGDGNLDPGEECDDGNTVPGDGCDANCMSETPISQVPLNQFNIGDSIGEAEAANGTIGSINHETVWSTGYNANDSVDGLNERFEFTSPTDYYENDTTRDSVFNHAVSGAIMADFATQANNIVTALNSVTPPDTAGMITILLGNNDVCAPSLDTMTDPVLFEEQYRAGLDVLAQSPETSSADIHVSSIPAIYWLWNAKRSNWWCRIFVWPQVPCENLLANPADDCESTASRLDPDTIYPGDGSNCIRRKTFHARIRDIYNPILQDVLQEYRDTGKLPNAYFLDVFDIQFSDSHVNGGDCFHPSEAGHALLADEEWCRSQWRTDDFICTSY